MFIPNKKVLAYFAKISISVLLFTTINLLSVSPVKALSVTGVSVTNTSPPNAIIAPGNHTVREYRTGNISTSTPVTIGAETTFSNQFSWFQGMRVNQPLAPDFALIYLRTLGYAIQFTVEDPLNEGYSIEADHRYRGYVTISREESLLVSASAGLLLGRFDDGSGPVIKLPLTVHGGGLSIPGTAIDPFGNKLIDTGDTFTSSNYTGTKTFIISFSSVPSPAGTLIFANFGGGEALLRFGLAPTHASGGVLSKPDFLFSGYPGPDGEPASALGHFVDIKVTSLNPVVDSDLDTIPDEEDNCPTTPNTDQLDNDSDGVGNVCDNCVDTPNSDQADDDNDAEGNVCEIIPVEADILSSINCKRTNGVVPVVIFSSEDFNALNIDITTLSLDMSPVYDKHATIHPEDVNNDGLLDAVLHLNKEGVCAAVEELAIKDNSIVNLEGELLNSDARFRAQTDISVVNR